MINYGEESQKAYQKLFAGHRGGDLIDRHVMLGKMMKNTGIKSLQISAPPTMGEVEVALTRSGYGVAVGVLRKLAVGYAPWMLIFAPLGHRWPVRFGEKPAPPGHAGKNEEYLTHIHAEKCTICAPEALGFSFSELYGKLKKDFEENPSKALRLVISGAAWAQSYADGVSAPVVARQVSIFNTCLDFFGAIIIKDVEADRMMKKWRERLAKEGYTGMHDGEEAPKAEPQKPAEQPLEPLPDDNDNNYTPFFGPGGM